MMAGDGHGHDGSSTTLRCTHQLCRQETNRPSMGRRWGGIGKLGIPKGQHKRWTTNGRRGRGGAKNGTFAFVYS